VAWGLKNEDPNPVVMSSADTLFDGSIPALKWRSVEALFQPSARNKIVRLLLLRIQRALSSYLLAWLEPGDFEEFSSETFYCSQPPYRVGVLAGELASKEPRSRLIPL